MYETLPTPVGQMLATGLTVTRPVTGRYYVVQKSGGPNENNLKAMYGAGAPMYPDGIAGFYPSIATAVAALANTRANCGDTLILAPGHTETISSATALTISVAGLYIRSAGNGNNRATITLDTATSATINVSAANVTFDNVIFVANFAAIASVFTLTTAKDFQLVNCEFRDTSAILNFVALVTTAATSNAADGLTIASCRRIGLGATSNTTIVSMLGTNDRVRIQTSYFAHSAVTTAGLMIIASGKIVTNADINGNVCNFVGSASATTGIIITTDGTTNSGVIRGNMIQSLDATTEILVTASSGFVFFQNFYSAVADKSGYLLPAADA